MTSVKKNSAKLNWINEQQNFLHLYAEVKEFIMNEYDIDEENIHEATSEVIELFVEDTLEFSRFNLNNKANCCAYVKRYAAGHASLMLPVTSEFLKHIPPGIISELLSNDLNIVSIGGGPGNDIIGFCSVLQNHPKWSISNLKLKIIEMHEGWQEFFDASFTAAKEGEYGAITSLLNRTDFETDFISVDLTEDKIAKEDREQAENAIKEADVILLVKVLSIMKPSKKKTILLQEVCRKMKENSIILIVDTNLAFTHANRKNYGVKELYYSKPKTFRPSFASYETVGDISYEVFAGQKITPVDLPKDIPS